MKTKHCISSVAVLSTCLLVGLLVISGCKPKKNNTTETTTVEKSENCETEYIHLSTRVFSSCSEAILAIESYLKQYSNSGSCQSNCEHARKMEAEFEKMKSFLEKPNSYGQFIKEGNANDGVFSSSSYETVRETWRSLYEKEKTRRYNLALNEITAEKFEPYLVNCAIKHCNDRWHRGGNSWTGWDFKQSERRGQITVSTLSNGKGKRGSGTFHIDMEGSGPLGMRQGCADVIVSGVINIMSDGSWEFTEDVDYSFKNIVHLDRLE